MMSLELHHCKERIADTAGELSDVISRMISLLRFENADVYTLCRECFTDDYMQFRSITSGDFHKLWLDSCQHISADAESKRLLALVGETLGTSDTQSQIERLKVICNDMQDHTKSLKRKVAEQKKLYTTLGALSGLAVSIMII